MPGQFISSGMTHRAQNTASCFMSKDLYHGNFKADRRICKGKCGRREWIGTSGEITDGAKD